CAAILWKDAAKAEQAAETMRITAADLHRFGMVDEVVPEPVPAHERPREVIQAVGEAINRHLEELSALVAAQGIAHLLHLRYNKFRRIGSWRESIAAEHGLPIVSVLSAGS
ncbi:MAG: acetyl-CoA carboxylase carboxyl transferase subunit alpha, partial [Chloroflexota bacterium]